MTDITELAQSMKAAAEKLKEIGIIHNYSKSVSAQIDFEKSSTPANVIALVETLEKAQETIAFQQGEIKALLSSLESRTVKLPKRHSMLLREDFNEDYHTKMAYKADEVHVSLAAAGIKVEAE